MDPTQALRDARRALERLSRASSVPVVIEQSDALGEAFRALDEWLSRGGFLPQQWSDAKRESHN